MAKVSNICTAWQLVDANWTHLPLHKMVQVHSLKMNAEYKYQTGQSNVERALYCMISHQQWGYNELHSCTSQQALRCEPRGLDFVSLLSH